ncbi:MULTISPECIES: FAD-dependent oxidoreductase [Amycolatopsis methanolica group]|uniref:FAD-dependent oxidoreductase n=1 Tax=Amycolatopsis methanolica group TaxID=2893674 RepID=UPI0034398C56
MDDVQVAVVGADPAGLLIALGLARAGIEVLVLDTGRDDIASANCAHDWSVLPGLDRLGILDDALRSGFADPRWCLFVLRTGERIDFDLGAALRGVTPFPFTLHLEHSRLCGILEHHLAREATASVERDVRVTGLVQDATGVDLGIGTADGARRVRARWVVGADGTSSTVRRLLGLGFPGYTWPERSVVALVEADFAALGYASTTLQVDDRHGAVVQKVNDRRWRYTFAEPLTRHEEGSGVRIPRVLSAVLGEAPFRIVDWHAARMHERSAERYRLGRVLLAGDAAHVTNRMIGHSPTSAFFDAFRLIEALTAVLAERAPESVLDAYAEDRRRMFHQHVSPIGAARKHLVSQISDAERLETELESYRRASVDTDELRDVLLLNSELEDRELVPPSAR